MHCFGQFSLFISLSLVAGLNADVKIIANPTAVENFGSVTISWDDDYIPAVGDYISYSCGPTNTITDDIGRCPVLPSPSLKSSNEDSVVKLKLKGHPPQNVAGKCIFYSLVNLRCDYKFQYIQNATSTALSTVIVPVLIPLNSPTQGHLAFGDTVSEMYVSWVSGSNKTVSFVKYGVTSGNLRQNQTTYDTTTYTASEICNSPANTTSQSYWRHPGYFHHSLLTSLLSSTRYYYQYGNDIDGWSEEKSFLSRPHVNKEIQQVKFIGYADQDWDEPGSVQTSALVLRDILDGWDSFVLHFGDLGYAEGDVSDWDHWQTQTESYTSRAPYMVSYGNHEYNYVHGKWKDQTLLPMRRPKIQSIQSIQSVQSNQATSSESIESKDDSGSFSPKGGDFGSDSNGECGIAMVHRFRAPSNGRPNGQGSLAWYSFDYGTIHVIQMSSEHNWLIGSEQYLWLDANLKQASLNRDHVPWIVITAHRMMYTTQLCEEPDYNTSLLFRKNIEPLLLKYKVDVMMVGHQHSYERSCAVNNGTCVTKKSGLHGVVHITAGSAGAGVEKCGFDTKGGHGNFSLVHINEWGYLRGNAFRDNFTISFVSDALGSEVDQIVLRK